MFSDFEVYLWGVLFPYIYTVISIEFHEEYMQRFSGFFVLMFVLVSSAFSWVYLVGMITYQIYRKFKR